jgi:hypothetical protein
LNTQERKNSYKTRILTFGVGSNEVSKTLSPISAGSQTKSIRRLVLPKTELVVRLPVKGEPNL